MAGGRGEDMSQYYVPAGLEKYVKWHIPFTAYFLYHYDKIFHIVEKELRQPTETYYQEPDDRIYHYRFL